ncbi:MAG: M48 family metalloprotease [Bdellovibrionales bacterium]|nr:M48 family metalloprotease [Bdellovibrionales bacterium]
MRPAPKALLLFLLLTCQTVFGHDPSVRTFESHVFTANFLKNAPSFLAGLRSKKPCVGNEKFPQSNRLVHRILNRLIAVSPINELYQKVGVKNEIPGIGCAQFSDETSVVYDALTFGLGEILDANSEDEIAFLLAHELGHYFLLHPILKIQVTVLGKSFDHGKAYELSPQQKQEYKKNLEFQADALGLQLLSAARYSASGATTAVSKFAHFDKESDTHPSPERRYLRIQEEIVQHQYALHEPTGATAELLRAQTELKQAEANQ